MGKGSGSSGRQDQFKTVETLTKINADKIKKCLGRTVIHKNSGTLAYGHLSGSGTSSLKMFAITLAQTQTVSIK